LRRTLRSGLSALRVNSDVAEAVLAHVKPGIRGVYDRYDLFDEKRQALDLWAGRLQSVVEPARGKPRQIGGGVVTGTRVGRPRGKRKQNVG